MRSATDPEIDALVAALHGPGAGLLIVRNQSLSPQQLEQALFRLGTARGGFGVPLAYEQWPGQSPRLRCCAHLSLLGNYAARYPDELGTRARVGQRIGEYKPAVDEAQEWHVDGSFLPRPKTGIALYAPPEEPMEVRIATCA
jgi:alpha-ketoglutarate-dependent taurine dioxygenase